MFLGHLGELLKQIAVDMKMWGCASNEMKAYTLGTILALHDTEWSMWLKLWLHSLSKLSCILNMPNENFQKNSIQISPTE